VLGAGKIGRILLKALLEKGALSVSSASAMVQHEEQVRQLTKKLGILGTDNIAAIRFAEIVFVCVKPQVLQEVMHEIRPHVRPDQLVISVPPQSLPAASKKFWEPRFLRSGPCPTRLPYLGCGMTAPVQTLQGIPLQKPAKLIEQRSHEEGTDLP
jgi:NADP oxidoreductase coenzyme F420-dependent